MSVAFMRRIGRCVGLALALAGVVSASAVAQSVGGSISPGSGESGVATTVVVTSSIPDAQVIGSSVNLQAVDSVGRATLVGSLRDDGREGDAVAGDRIFTLRFQIYETKLGSLTYRVSAAFQGRVTRVFSSPFNFTVAGATPTGISITSPANLAFLNLPAIVVSGVANDAQAAVAVNGVPATRSGTGFSATIPLIEGNNIVTAVAANANGTSATASIQVTLDTTPPRVTVDSPVNGFVTTEPSVGVSGIVNDIVVGTINPQQAAVTINGVAAEVSNRTYSRSAVPLSLGSNVITVVARDQTGNSATTTVTVTRREAAKRIRIVSGNDQSGLAGTRLSAPLVVQLLENGIPAANKPVIFKVVENDALFEPVSLRQQSFVATTDSQGQAQAQMVLGNRAGTGNNTVEAYAVGYEGTALFVASGRAGAAARISVDSGNNQFGAIGQALALPFVAVVTDVGHNRLGGVPVTFTVRQGNGQINGSSTFQTVTDSDGRALATLSLGPLGGQDNNVVEATFSGNSTFPAAFSASGLVPGDAAQTTISGVVLNNSNQPIPGVTMRLYRYQQGTSNNQHVAVGTPVVTNAAGAFRILRAPVGFIKLMADGSTSTGQGRLYPTLEYDMVTVAGRDNTVGMPIYLPELDPNARVCVSETQGGTLRMSSSPGFSLTIRAGAATFPGGSKTGCVSVTPVNPDKVPMVPGFGQQPRYVVTIQPVGTTFNPPAAISIPNVDGLAPNAKTEMYSYDHDLAAFVAIGTGTVSGDGSVIASDPGVGVIKAGWHCGGNPNSTGSAGTCPTCQKCQGSACVPQTGACDDQKRCTKDDKCVNGACVGTPVDTSAWTDDFSGQFDARLPPDIPNKLNRIFDFIPGMQGTKFKEARVGVKARFKNCCGENTGIIEKGMTEASGSFQLTAELRKVPLWGTPTISRELDFSVVIVSIDFQLGVYLKTSLRLNAEGGLRTNQCENENCVFGEANVSLDPELQSLFEAIACLETLWTTKVCGGVTITPLALRMNLAGRVTFNKPACGSGLGGSLSIGKVVARAEFSLDVPAAPQRIVIQYEVFGGVAQL